MIKYRYITENGGYNEVTDITLIPENTQYETIEFDLDEELTASNIELYTELLKEKVVHLRIKAKGLAIGKTGINPYILAQVDFYEIKFENASNQNPVSEIDADLEAEGLRDFGLNLQDFKNLIIQMYNAGKEKETLLMSFIEQGRSAILTLISNHYWNRVENAFLLIDSLQGVSTVSEAREIKNQILEL